MKILSKLFSSKRLRVGLGITVSLGALYLALRGINLGEVWLSIKNARWGFVGLALACFAINTGAKTLRWKLLVGPSGDNIPSFTYLLVLLAGQMLNTIFPARLGDLARAYILGGKGPGRAYVLGTIVLEKVLDSLAYITLIGIIILLIPLPNWVGSSILVFILVTVAITVGILLFVFWPTPFQRLLNQLLGKVPKRINSWITPRIEQGLASLEIIRRRDDLFRLIIWTAITWGLAIAINHFVLLALDIHLPISASFLILVGLQAGISLPTIPGTIGLFEYICILTLSVFGIDQALAFSYGLLLHAILLIPAMLAGILSFWILGLSNQRQKFKDFRIKQVTENSNNEL